MGRTKVFEATEVGAPLSDAAIADIARQLDHDGEFRLTLVPDLPQRVVDLRWAALRIGRLLGRPVDVAVSSAAMSSAAGPVTVRMTCAVATRPEIPRQRDHD
jgi:hypothetical protein